MLSKRLEEELNKHINAELYSSYLYLSMSAYLASVNLNGFANWMNIQAEEEKAHAMKFFDYVVDRGGRVKLFQIDEPKFEWDNIIHVYEDTLAHEQHVSALINNLVNLAVEENDHATNNMLQWFVAEQVEEEATASDILDQLKLLDGKGAGLFMLDREFKQRTFTPINEGE
jgi:ferritin